MKSKPLIAKIAITAMAVAALGSPVAAFAAAGPALSAQYALSQAPLSQVQLSHSPAKLSLEGGAKPVSSAAILQLPDPIEVAAKYAPDTVEEWKKTLDSYNKLVPVKTLTLSAAALPASGSTRSAQPAPNLALAPATANATDVVIRKGNLGEAESVTLQMVKAVEGDVLKATTTATLADGPGIKVASAAAPAGDGIFQSRIALAQAVAKDDAEKIKQTLDKLLGQYKAAIAELQQAK
ncbi:hypothetical protein [Cohnella sp. GbtcB17]|uniref:hypothetical protein n=1 Tax=Cohnella sp. GbtcB17 TaxID=2824762 RepID=UPI001C30995A|nr:hypothetical protein [Cohnella sp. GbtcB17]